MDFVVAESPSAVGYSTPQRVGAKLSTGAEFVPPRVRPTETVGEWHPRQYGKREERRIHTHIIYTCTLLETNIFHLPWHRACPV